MPSILLTKINPPPVFSNVDEILRGSEAMIGHKLVPMESSRRKRCKYCQKLRQKTASGGIAETAYKEIIIFLTITIQLPVKKYYFGVILSKMQ
jgi:hypothetical protein